PRRSQVARHRSGDRSRRRCPGARARRRDGAPARRGTADHPVLHQAQHERRHRWLVGGFARRRGGAACALLFHRRPPRSRRCVHEQADSRLHRSLIRLRLRPQPVPMGRRAFAACPESPMRRLASRSFQPFAGEDIRSLIEAQARLRADHPYLVWRPVEGPRVAWTYGEFARRVARIAAGLHARGVVAGDRVLVHLDNCPEAIFAWFGCAWLGAVAVTTNARSSIDELAYYADDAAVVAGITQPRLAATVAAACPRLAWIAVTTTDNGVAPDRGAPAASESFDAIDADPDRLPARARDPMAPFSVQYTS